MNMILETKGATDIGVEEVKTAIAGLTADIAAKYAPVSDMAKRLEALETAAARPAIGGDAKAQTTDEQKSFGVYLRRGDAGLGDVERKALTVATDASAGFLAPTTFGDEILKKLREFSPIRQYAKVVQIGGKDVKYPRRLTSTVATWVDEVDARTESGMTFEQVTLTPHELATFVEVSRQLLEDNRYDLEGELASDLGESFAIAEGAAFVSGNGTGKPKGVLAATGIAEVVSGNAATLGSNPGDLLIDMFAKLQTAHAQNGAWAMNRTTLAAIRKVKDGNGQYIWQPGLQAGQPSTILGRPVIEMVDLPNVAADAYPIVFGDWSGYRIVDRVDMSILVDPYSGAKNGITTFHARKRVGGDVTHADRFVKLKISAT
ncbi:hypothetical protein GCM10019059_06500 [Camelimonas fluminis]|uniref:Phage major capsid protein n=1 Tax=Camelimonas fluminis TaxID=1576911 RepID=A0ABV7UH48_9HYPH|nr:phage major capsid protein [Camelimonas fluminis]GHE49940.1 hypothetical protein GCM10019059_06500 [Camelimonas fluminis]